ncbi:MAG: CDGSH iron-sulfur domain-containing protein [Hyphomicrobiaceae bacterium]
MSDEPIAAQLGPYQVELEEGKRYFWCKCGRSENQPFCDGKHKDTDIQPKAFVAESSGTFNLCGCKQTDDDPFCDGSHNIL